MVDQALKEMFRSSVFTLPSRCGMDIIEEPVLGGKGQGLRQSFFG